MGIEGINQRISDIQSRMLALQTQQKAKPATATGTSSSAGAPGSAGSSGQEFAGVLQNAVSSSAASTVTSAGGRSYAVNDKGIPVELAQYGNGHIPTTALESVGTTGHHLWAPAAESLTTMMADAKRDGVNIGITDSYRPYTEQVDLARRKGLYSQGGLAAKPGTSEHGWGMAADLDLNPKALAWMRQNGKNYGFVNNVSRESWHWAYKPNGV